jgi:hypothetical protein
MRCHSASSLFSAIFVFQKSYTGIFLELDETKAECPEIYRSFQRTEEEMERSQEAASTPGGAAQGLVTPPYAEGPLVHF